MIGICRFVCFIKIYKVVSTAEYFTFDNDLASKELGSKGFCLLRAPCSGLNGGAIETFGFVIGHTKTKIQTNTEEDQAVK